MVHRQVEPPDSDRQVFSGDLPRGRHFLPREIVERHQRERLLAAVAVAISEHGYVEVTIKHVILGAGVSRRTFYEHFAHLQDAMLAAYDASFARLLATIEEACLDQPDWPARMRAAIAAALRFAAAEPEAARLLSVEAFTACPEGTRRVLDSREHLTALLAPGRRYGRRTAQLPAITERALINAIWTTIGDRLVQAEPERVAELEPQLVELTLLPYLSCRDSRRPAPGRGGSRA